METLPDMVLPNILADSALTEIRQRITQQGYSELHLPPSETEFSEKILGITWTGTLTLTNGKLRGLETLHRVGEATMSFNEFMNNGGGQFSEIAFTVDLGFTTPTTTHDLRVIFMKKELEGVVKGTMSNVTFLIVLGFNFLTRKARLINLKFKELGHVETDIKGLGTVLDFLASKISKIVLNRIKWEMATVVEENVKSMIGDAIGDIQWPTLEQQDMLIGGVKKGGATPRNSGGGGGTGTYESSSKKAN